jgi:Flp pilus assembly protein TadG
MSDRLITQLVQHFLDRFLPAKGGNVAVIFAILLVPLLGFVGAAVDYSRASSARSSMQVALDSSALMVSKDLAATPTMTAAQITAKATTYFNALFTNPNAPAVTISAAFTPNTGNGATVLVSGSGVVPTKFLTVVGFPQLAINSSSTTTWGSTRLRVALVLDTTGSMGNNTGKIEALKGATAKLLDQLKANATDSKDVYVSIIPFSKNVNANPANYQATWIDWTEWLAEPPILDTAKGGSKPSGWSNVGPGSNCPFTDGQYGSHGFTCTDRPATAAGAVSATKVPSTGYICPSVDSGYENRLRIGRFYNGCYNSVPTVTTTSTTVFTCIGRSNCTCTTGWNVICKQTSTTSGAPYTHVWRPADTASPVTAADTAATPDKSSWNGCVTERGASSGPSGDYDRKVTAPSITTVASLFPAEQNSYCSPVVMPLSNDWTAMNAAVTALYPLGGTNQPIGLVHGWQSLVGGGPFPTPPVKETNFAYQDVIVLMSDGLNTQDRWYGDGSNTSLDVDSRMYQSSSLGTCPNIWAEKIVIYTVHVNTDGGPTSTLLQNCASTNKDTGLKEFQMVTTPDGIGTAFDKIATQLSRLRVSK